MISMVHQSPVSPPPASAEDRANGDCSEDLLMRQPCAGNESLLMGFDEDVDFKLALLDDPIVGIEHVVANEHGPGALVAKPLPSPPPTTLA